MMNDREIELQKRTGRKMVILVALGFWADRPIPLHQKPPFSETPGFSHREEKMGAIAHFSLIC